MTSGTSTRADAGAGTAPAGGEGRVPAPLLVLAAIASVQCGSAVATTLFDAAGSSTVVLMRLLFSGVILAVALRPRFWRWSRESLSAVAILGIAMAAMNLSFYQSIRTVPLGVAVTLEFLGPLTVTLVQTRRLRDLAWAVLAAAGVGLLGLSGGATASAAGMGWALLAGAFWGGYILASSRVGRLVPGTSGLAVALLIGTLLALPFGAGGLVRVADQPAVLLGGLGVAVLSSLLPYSFELSALRRIPTRVFGILMSLEPASAAVAGLLIIGQRLLPAEIVAVGLVSIASAGATLTGRRRDPDADAPADDRPGPRPRLRRRLPPYP